MSAVFLEMMEKWKTWRRWGICKTVLAGVKASFLAATTLIVAPVDGLRALRPGVFFTLSLPKPGRDASLPATAASMIRVIEFRRLPQRL